MKHVLLLLFICFFASWSFAQQNDDKKKSDTNDPKLIQSLNLDSFGLEIRNRQSQAQVGVQVEVEAPDYPGLDVSFENPANSLRSYKPYTKQELQVYSDLLLDYKLTDFDRTETARPHKPGRIFRATVPD